VVGVDDQHSRAIADRRAGSEKPLQRISTGRLDRDGFFADGSTLLRVAGARAEPVADLAGVGSLRGAHNAQNAGAAFAVASALGIPDETIRAALRTFPGLHHRMEEVARQGKVLFVNDSKATNADSTEKALLSFERPIFWILGGKAKEGGVEPLKPYFTKIERAYLIGEATEAFAATLEGHVPVQRCGSLDRAVPAAAADASRSGAGEPVVLLSPACASYDQYPNFEVRGDHFRDLVRALAEANPSEPDGSKVTGP
jgi:UDP-N-acetylmuramoylalanine--D-glutamate ligase